MVTKTYTAKRIKRRGRDRDLYVQPLYDFVMSLPDSDAREAFASRCGVCLGQMRNVMYGLRPSNPKLSVLIERHTEGRVTRVHLHPEEWREIWPDSDRLLAMVARDQDTAESL